jgi:hypothetical protein
MPGIGWIPASESDARRIDREPVQLTGASRVLIGSSRPAFDRWPSHCVWISSRRRLRAVDDLPRRLRRRS